MRFGSGVPAYAAALLATAGVLFASHARAGEDGARGPLEPPAVERVLGGQGYSDIRNLRRRGGLWLADASGPTGQRVRAVVDAFTGEVTGLAPLQGSTLAPGARRAADARL